MRHQRGFTLIELTLAVGLLAFGTLLSFQGKLIDLQQKQAEESGQYLLQYNNAVREWVSANIGAPAATKIGSAWLKSTSCPGGLSAVAYLPCYFPNATVASPIPGGALNLTTTITSTGTAPNLITVATTVTSPYKVKGSQVRSDLSGLAALTATSGSQNTDPTGGSVDGTIKSTVSTGVITLVASNSGATDPWLRTDGSNTMNANLAFTSTAASNMREIQGVSRLQNAAVSALTIGNSGGAAAGYTTTIDANSTLTGDLVVQNNGSATAGILVSKGSMRTGNGAITASANVMAYGGLTTPRYLPSQNAAYAIKPSGSSQFAQLWATGSVSAPIYYDRNNTSYYADLNNVSNLNQVHASAGSTLMTDFRAVTTIGGYAKVDGIGVSTNPQIGDTCAIGDMNWRRSDGMFLYCYQGAMQGGRFPNGGNIITIVRQPTPTGIQNDFLGYYRACFITGMQMNYLSSHGCIVSYDANLNWTVTTFLWTQPNGAIWCQVSCSM